MSATSQLSILTITSPAFLLMALGFCAIKAGWLEKNGLKALAWFTTRIALPAAIFSALISKSLKDILNLDYLLIYGFGSLLAYFVVFAIAKNVWKKSLTESAFFGLGSSMSNTILIGYPIIIELFGPAALIPFALTLVVENLLILPLSLALAETGKRKELPFLKALQKSLNPLIKNPIILAIILGLLFSAFTIDLPPIAAKTVNSLAGTASGLAQFTIGGILAGVTLVTINRDMSLVIIGKLLIHPAAILLAILVFPPVDPVFTSIAIILSCMPMFSIYAILALEYELEEFCSAILLPTTIISFFTINVAIWLLRS